MTNKIFIPLLALATSLALLGPARAAAPDFDLDRATAAVEAASRAFDAERVLALADELATHGGDGTDPDVTTLRLRAMFYGANILRFRRTLEEVPESDEIWDRQVAVAEKGEELGTKLLEERPDSSLLHTLVGEFIALRITGPNGAWLGPRAADHVEKAIELDPENPLAELAAGRRYLYTPGAFGGSDALGMEHLGKAEKILNDRERALLTERRKKILEETTDPEARKAAIREAVVRTRAEVWRLHEEILVQLAIGYLRQDRKSRARIALKRALASNPDDEAAKFLLRRLEAGEED